ncbi:MAG: ABC transporter permease [Candidatus Helarchaeota archaeon]
MIREKLFKLVISSSSIIFLFIAWHLMAIFSGSNIIPTPIEVVEEFLKISFIGDNFGYLLIEHIFASLLRVLIGFFYAAVIAIPLGIFMGVFRKLEWALSPIFELLRPIPPFAWIPFALILFGLGIASQSFVIFIGAFFPILTNTVDGVKRTSNIYIDVAKTLGANKLDIIMRIVLPSALPSILVGLRIGLGVGWMCVIAAELVGLNIPLGLGYLIQYSAQFGNFGLTVSAMLTTGLIGILMTISVKLIENWLLDWRNNIAKNKD